MVEYQQDNIYIKKVLDGDRNAFAYLVDKYKAMVYSLAVRLMKDREEAEEVSQDAFLKAYQALIDGFFITYAQATRELTGKKWRVVINRVIE